MATNNAVYTLGEIAERVSGRLVGPPNIRILRVVSAGCADPEALTFATSNEFVQKADSAPIGGVLVASQLRAPVSNHIVVDNARAAFGQILALFAELPELEPGISELAFVHPTATVASTARIGPFVTVGRLAVIEEHARIYGQATVGENCRVGAHSVIHSQASLIQDVSVGARCIIYSGARIGSDGFGFEIDGESIVKVPQIGSVRIGDDVEIGANTCVDRGAIDETVIGDSVKIDNLCQIGHNVQIGKGTVIAGTVAIGGSATIGSFVLIGANAGISDHVQICDRVIIGARSTVLASILEPGEYFGTPVMSKIDGIRVLNLQSKLPEIWKRMRVLEQKLGGEPSE